MKDNVDYIKHLEKRNEELEVVFEKFTLIKDILKSRVNIIDSEFFSVMHPKQICSYMESLGWTVKYEKTHERYVTRCYMSPHKDAKCKVFIQDLYASTNATTRHAVDGIAAKAKEVVALLARLHKKGELEVIFEILSEREN